MSFDPVAVIRTLGRHNVRFVVIGGIAAAAHGSPMLTQDLDVCYDRRYDNLEHLAAAFVELRARLRGAPDDVPFLLDARTLAAGDCFTFTTQHGNFDILGTPSGSTGYDDLAQQADEFDFDGITVKVASLDSLMTMKRAAGRTKDLLALEHLGAVRDELEGR